MWNASSVIAWLIGRSGMDTESIHLQEQDVRRDGTPDSWLPGGRKWRRRLRL